MRKATKSGEDAEEIPRESIRAIEEIRALRIQSGKSLQHEIGAGAPCRKCGDACVGGFSLHFWRKICMTCKCPPENHEIQVAAQIQHNISKLFGAEFVDSYGHFFTLDTKDLMKDKENDEKLAEQYQNLAAENAKTNTSDKKEKEKGDTITLEWIPANTSKKLVLKYISSLPIENQPITGTVGAVERMKQLQIQLPAHDVDASSCKAVKEEDLAAFTTFVDNYKKNALGIGIIKEQDEKSKEPAWKCEKCKGELSPGSVAVFAERAGPDKCWHPRCFRCEDCKQLLVDLIYFWDNNKLYCGRDYANHHRPRCNACDELIMSGQYTQAEAVNWHVEHFCCWSCDEFLGGQQYINKEDHPYCMNCYRVKFAKTCGTCHGKIDATLSRLSYQDTAWHADPKCFKCIQCNKNLMGQPFVARQGTLFCSKACRKQHSASGQKPK